MKIAIIGSRSIHNVDIGHYITDCDEIVSGGAIGVDTCAAEYANAHGIRLKVFYPQYNRYGRAAPILRNRSIVDYADKVIAFWDGASKGTLDAVKYAQKSGKAFEIVLVKLF